MTPLIMTSLKVMIGSVPGLVTVMVIELVTAMALATLMVTALSVLDSDSESVLSFLELFLLVPLSRILEWRFPRFLFKKYLKKVRYSTEEFLVLLTLVLFPFRNSVKLGMLR
jgi:hypothetical protein